MSIEQFQLLERKRQTFRISNQFRGNAIGHALSLDTNLARQPPHRRVIEKQCLDYALQQVDQEIGTLDMSDLVRKQRFE